MFVKPLQGRGKQAQEQRARLGTAQSDIDTNTIASTHNGSRKPSTHMDLDDENSEPEVMQLDVDDEIDEEFKEGSQ